MDDEWGCAVAVAGLAAIYATVAWVSEIGQDARVERLNEATVAACDRSYKTHGDKSVQEDCKTTFATLAQEVEDNDLISIYDTTMFFDKNFEILRDKFADEAYSHSIPIALSRKNHRDVENKLVQSIRDIEINGAKVYADVNVAVNFDSITTFKNAEGKDVFTGKWKLAIADKDSEAVREFSYDYVTGKATGPSGTSAGTIDFRYYYGGAFHAGYGKGGMNINMTHTGDLQDCSTLTKERACMITDAIHNVLNGADPKTGATPGQVRMYQSAIKSAYNNREKPIGSYADIMDSYQKPAVIQKSPIQYQIAWHIPPVN